MEVVIHACIKTERENVEKGGGEISIEMQPFCNRFGNPWCLAWLAIYHTLPFSAVDTERTYHSHLLSPSLFFFSLLSLFIIGPPPRTRVLNEIKTGIHSHLCGPGGQLGGKER